MYSAITRTCSGWRSKRRASSRRASKTPCVETHAVSSSPSQRATAACGSSGVWTCAGVSQVSSTVTSAAGERRVRIAAHRLGRLFGEALLVEPRARRRAAAAPRSRARGRRAPAAAASIVSAATAAMGSPAHEGSAVSTRAPPIVNGPVVGPSTARTPVVARAASRSSAVTRHACRRRAQDASVQHARAARRRPCSAPRRSHGAGRPDAGAGLPTIARSASSGQVVEVVLLVDERPDVLEAPLHLALRLDEPLRHPALLTRGAQDRALDLRVGAAAAQVPGHRRADLLLRRGARSSRAARSPRRAGRACRSRTGARPRRRSAPGAARPSRRALRSS